MGKNLSESSCKEFYSHLNPEIPLKDHLEKVSILCKEYAAKANADLKVLMTAELIGKTHDFGKYTRFFQKRLRGESVPGDLSRHSRLSAIFASWLIGRRVNDPILPAIAFLCVDSHHSNLKNFSKLKDEMHKRPLILKQVNSIRENMDIVSKELEEVGAPEASEFINNFKRCASEVEENLKRGFYVLRWKLDESDRWKKYFDTLLIFSCLIDADKKVAGSVDLARQIRNIPSSIVPFYIKRRFGEEAKSMMDEIRRSIFSEVRYRLIEILSGEKPPRVMTLTAPTGSGKTLTSFFSALRLRESTKPRRIIYCLPYINIIEQTYSVFEDVLFASYGKKPDISLLLKHHHLFFPSHVDDEVSLDEMLLLVDSWESEMIVTTFEQLLRTLIGCRNSQLKKLHNLAGSIIILDEIQAIPLEYWRLVRDILTRFVEHSAATIFMMTATMPTILKKEDHTGIELLPNHNSYFKKLNRTVLIPRLKETVTPEQLVDFFFSKWKGEPALIVLNTIKTSKRVYRGIAERLGDEAVRFGMKDENLHNPEKTVIAYLSTSVIPKERERRIKVLDELLRNGRTVILVSTQVVEAGVDLDFGLVIRDIGPIDSVVQVAGRCNRHGKRGLGKIYVLRVIDERNREDSKKIYGSILPSRSYEFLADKDEINESELQKIVDAYFEDIMYRTNAEKSEKSLSILEDILNLNFEGLSHFSLIEDDKPKLPVYVMIDDDAERLLKNFIELIEKLKTLDGTNLKVVFEHKAYLRRTRVEMEKYTVEVYKNEETLRSLKRLLPGLEVRVVTRGVLEAYYDGETGYKSSYETDMLRF